jgi:photosystem II stability/assembly factor-like uncharacterized protein
MRSAALPYKEDETPMRVGICTVIRGLLLALAAATANAGVGVWTTNGPQGLLPYGEIIVDSQIPGTLYAGTGTGLAKSTDDGATWAVISTIPSMPLAAANGTVYASAGFCDVRAISCTSTVYKSVDRGQQWQTLFSGSVLGTRIQFGITIDPTSSSTLYRTSVYTDANQFVASEVNRSTDGGQTWTQIDPAEGYSAIVAFVIDPSNPATLYLADVPEGNQPVPPPPPHVFKSTDAGSTWTILTSSIGSVSALVLDPLAPATLYAATSNGIFKSLDAGRTILSVNSVTLLSMVGNPTHEDHLYGTVGNGGGGVLMSTDAGATWSPMNTGLTDLNTAALAIDGDGSVLHVATPSGVFDFGLAFPPCPADGHTLCLNNGRFSVTADFQATSEGPSAPAAAVPLTADTGYFWFFDPNNVEVVTKVLNGCSTNGHYWFFASGLTNVGVQINVTDTATGAAKPYSNAFGTAFPPIQDTSAFPCP